MSETGEGSRLRLAPRPTGGTIDNPGLSFWNKLTPDRQKALAQPIREAEIAIAQLFPDGFKSPLIDKADQIRDEDRLEKQTDMTSCTYHATANALRILDEPRPEYSKDQLQATISALAGYPQATIERSDLEKIFAGSSPYSRFTAREVGNLQLRMGKAPEMAAVFQAFAKGAVGVASWLKHPGTSATVIHARTIAGFEKGTDNSLTIHVIDPYGVKQESWSFRDWYIGLHMDVFGNERGYSDENITNYAARMGEKGAIGSTSVAAAKVWLIEKKRSPLVLKKPA